MDTAKLELGIIGDFLTGSFSAHPSPLKGEEGLGLRPEHFSDPSARAAFELIAAADLQDPAALLGLLCGRVGDALIMSQSWGRYHCLYRTAAVLSGWRGNGEPSCQHLAAPAAENGGGTVLRAFVPNFATISKDALGISLNTLKKYLAEK